MKHSKRIKLSGWGASEMHDCSVLRPEKRREVNNIFALRNERLIGRGAGRAYGDAAVGEGAVVLSQRLDRFLTFDREEGVLRVQAGVMLADMLNVILPQGWMFPVIPGTKYVTAGGMAACDIHGKNQYAVGSISRHIVSLQLVMADGSRRNCSPAELPELFFATVGGMGMTGFIEEVTFRLKRIESLSLNVRRRKVRNLEELLACFEQERGNAEYMIGWIDHFASGESLGKGTFEAARHAPKNDGIALERFVPERTRFSIPRTVPGFFLNRWSMALHNRLRFRDYTDDWQDAVVPLDGFFHPLDKIGHWNRLYGRRGFFQLQCLIPEGPHTAGYIKALLSTIQKTRQFSYLAVIKYHGPSEAMMGFCAPGYSIALDFRNTKRVRSLIVQLHDQIAAWGGRVYLSKDALLTAEQFEAMYAHALPAWRRALHHADPGARILSRMSQRLKMRG